jgi:hypothetical protein
MSTRINDLGPDLIGASRAFLNVSPRAAVEARRALDVYRDVAQRR